MNDTQLGVNVRYKSQSQYNTKNTLPSPCTELVLNNVPQKGGLITK